MDIRLLETERLYLRNFKISDFAAVHEYASLESFSQYQIWGPNSEQDTLEFLQDRISAALQEPRVVYDMAIVLKATDQLIGGALIELESSNSKVACLGYAMNPKFQNQGYTTEIAQRLIKFGFEQLELRVIYALCDTRNTASFRVMEKCGMQKVGIVPQDRNIQGEVYDSYRYEIYPTATAADV